MIEDDIQTARSLIARVHTLKAAEDLSDDLDDRIGARHFRNDAESGLGRWFAQHGPRVLNSLEQLDNIANALNTFVEHRRSCAVRTAFFMEKDAPPCNCGLAAYREDLLELYGD